MGTLEDLDLGNLIEELGRVTCVTSSDTRQFSEDWYWECVHAASPGSPMPTSAAKALDNKYNGYVPLERESVLKRLPLELESPLERVAHAIKTVREEDCQWKFLILTLAERRTSTSGGA